MPNRGSSANQVTGTIAHQRKSTGYARVDCSRCDISFSLLIIPLLLLVWVHLAVLRPVRILHIVKFTIRTNNFLVLLVVAPLRIVLIVI